MVGCNNITKNDLRQLVTFAQGEPEYLPFTKACFCVAHLVGVLPEEVINACTTENKGELPEIVEAMRVPTFSKFIEPNKGEVLIF